MYTFLDKGDRSITLKPEGTAGVARAFIEHSLYAQSQPTKLYYVTPVFRYEAPQSGRLRQHHQFGVEVFGAKEPSIDAEIIGLAMSLFNRLGIKELSINISSIGCPKCRPKYQKALKIYLEDRYDKLCTTCQERYERNPLRILDCKEESCQRLLSDVPMILDYLCEECNDHFESLKQYLQNMGLEYEINPMIVRGLDYYTKTVFEIIANEGKFKGTVCGGGRYDGLVEECGGPATSGVGFGMGLDRLIMVMEGQKIDIPSNKKLYVYVATIGEAAKFKAMELITEFRNNHIAADMDHVGRSLKSQFKYSDKLDVPWVCIIGDNDLKENIVKLRDMETGKEVGVSFDNLINTIAKKTDKI